MLRKLTLLTLAGLVILAGCGGPPKILSFKPKSQDETIITSQIMKIQSGLNNKSVDLMMQPYSEDVYVGNFHKYLGIAAPGAFRSISKSQLRGAYTDLLRSVKEVSMEITRFELTVTGDRASAQGRIEMVYKVDKGRGESKLPDVIMNDVVWRLKRGPDGWKIHEEIFQ